MPPPVAWENDPLWFKDAVIYQLHVKAFQDSTGDGIGDLGGVLRHHFDLGELAGPTPARPSPPTGTAPCASYPNAAGRIMPAGSRTFETGASPVNSGGDTEFLSGTARSPAAAEPA